MTCREVLQRAEIKCSTTKDPGDLEGAWSGRTIENNIFEAHSRERRGLRVRFFPPAGSVGGTRGATNRLGGSRDCVRAAPRPLAPGPPA